MRAFEIHLNGKRLCTAGIGGDGVLTVLLRCGIGPGRGRSGEDLGLEIGGLAAETGEHVGWKSPRLCAGDELYVRVADTDRVDKPTTRRRPDPARDLEAEKRYVEAAAERLGWRLVKPEQSA